MNTRYASIPAKYYPVQGSNKFGTVSFPMTKAFRIDCGAMVTQAATAVETFTKGTIILGWVGRVVEAFEGLGAATLIFGFTGTHMISTTLATGALTLGKIVCQAKFTTLTDVLGYVPYVCSTGDDTFDVTCATTGLSAGKIDIFITYIPLPSEDLSTKDFKQIVCT